jgi:hypothetical protein
MGSFIFGHHSYWDVHSFYMNPNFFLRYNGIFFNLFFILVVLIVKDPLLAMAEEVFFNDKQNIIFGIMILSLMIAEIYAIYWKIPIIVSRADSKKTLENANVATIVLWIGRLLVHTVLAIAVGIAIGNELFAGLLIFVTIVKELFILVFMANRNSMKISIKKEIFINLILWVSATVFYIVIWENLAQNLSLNASNSALFYAELAAAFVIFSFFFFPIQAIYIIEDITLLDTKKEHLFWYSSLVLAIIAGMSSLF